MYETILSIIKRLFLEHMTSRSTLLSNVSLFTNYNTIFFFVLEDLHFLDIKDIQNYVNQYNGEKSFQICYN